MGYNANVDVLRNEVIALAVQSRPKEAELQVAQLDSLKEKLLSLETEHFVCLRQAQVVQSLYVPVLRKRWNEISKPDYASEDWLFDPQSTSFTQWLESQDTADGWFCITGRAGSGKSTLMKFASGDPRTIESLKRWAASAKLCTASYYFWNQGYEMQNSQHGLFQSLLYQVLKAAPALIPIVCLERFGHEEWEIDEVEATLRRVATQEELDVKFCFFIDGLDEYDGAEEEVVEMLKFLSTSEHIKICVSTRPRSVFEDFFQKETRTFEISNFTKAGMRQHVHQRLLRNEKFQRLASQDPRCETLDTVIADLAQGVWLWVFLVTRELVQAVNRNEGFNMLWKTVHQFPSDLEAYFERIIKAVRPQYLEEMSQIFLVTVDELQPLPLFAFSQLERERSNPDYAVEAPIQPVRDSDLSEQYPTMKSLIQNRCSDLLVVGTDQHPVFLSHPVDFLHLTVREFLQDRYYEQLQANLKTEFNSMVSLSKIMLVLLKSLDLKNFRDPKSLTQVIGLTDELLYYAYETEKRSTSPDTPLVAVLDELNRVNSHHARDIKNHWTQARDPLGIRGDDEYHEGGNCTFLALAVQARLVKYVRAKLDANPSMMHKRGRPLLDYALRPRRSTPIRMPYHSQRDDTSVEIAMVRLLLERGADPNQPVYLNDGKTVWILFLISLHASKVADQTGGFDRATLTSSLKNACYQACELLIRYGARNDSSVRGLPPTLTVRGILEAVFGSSRADALEEQMGEKTREAQQAKGACALM
ncbi:hypothetical protein BDW02DRAFT_165100 [Decorospora gaudefroyi]|uniref:NACHT domain-containing protein n=1 Tax=Decorospora gaudefroyi TaxID=184978 RepID=A0A6A5K435_9PLEO|nr:hypothetical protein BDW02DRAFT_165100 [Decorospora gaudefroyi]